MQTCNDSPKQKLEFWFGVAFVGFGDAWGEFGRFSFWKVYTLGLFCDVFCDAWESFRGKQIIKYLHKRLKHRSKPIDIQELFMCDLYATTHGLPLYVKAAPPQRRHSPLPQPSPNISALEADINPTFGCRRPKPKCHHLVLL